MAKVDISSKSGSATGGNYSLAMAAAWTDIKANGGQIYLDSQSIRMDTTCSLIPDSGYEVPLDIVGDGSSRILCNGSNTQNLITGANLVHLGLRDLCLVSNGAGYDGNNIVNGISAFNLTIERTRFVGLKVNQNLIGAGSGTALALLNSRFGGCAGPTIVEGVGCKRILIENCEFLDYMTLLNTYHSKSPDGVTNWVYIHDAESSSGASHSTAHLRSCRFDEGAANGVYVKNWGHLVMEHCNFNAAGAGNGIKLENVTHAVIKQCNVGYTANNVPILKLINCTNVTVIGQTRDAGPFRIETDSASAAGLKLLQSPDVEIDVV